ncbi:MAG TPA: hypothetical protein VHZ55_07135 [Bryobacteraceae bacterium]|jgi:hypothetical protein|nr:hypothetical protein [Bryobacteraceae bacterium]
MRFALFASVLSIVLISVAPIEVKDLFHTRGHLHDLGHFAAFFATAILFCWKYRGIRRTIAVCSGLFLLAIASEALEVAIYHHQFEWTDVAVDSAGVIGGWLLGWAVGFLSRAEAL